MQADSRAAGLFRSWWRVLAVLVLLWIAWQVRQPLLLLFGALLVATALSAAAAPLTRLGLSQRVAVLAVTAALAAFAALGLWQLGEPLSEQLQGLRGAVPQAWQALNEWLAGNAFGQRLLQWLDDLGDGELPLAGIAGLASSTLGALGAAALVVVTGVFLAVEMSLYRRGLLQLIPRTQRAPFDAAAGAVGDALTRWLLGQVLLMAVIGSAVAIGLFMLGMPLALALGLIAGLLEFVPFFGPIVSGLLAVLVAFAEGPQQALYVALLFVALQQLEGVLLVPLIQRWTVRLPPVLGLMSVLLFATLFGPLGVLLGTPLMVVIMVLVRKLYVEDVLQADAAHSSGAPARSRSG